MFKKAKLVFREDDYKRFREHLIRREGLEEACLAVVGVSEGRDGTTFTVRSVEFPNSYICHGFASVEMDPLCILRFLDKFRASPAMGVLDAHSHPFSDYASFSAIDDSYYTDNLGDIVSRKAGAYYIRLVYGRDEEGFSAEYWDPSLKETFPIREIVVVGGSGLRKVISFKAAGGRFGLPFDRSRLDRNVLWLGERGQVIISRTVLGCGGAGGIMNVFVRFAAHMGFKKFIIADDDTLERSNFNRFLGSSENRVGRHKVDLVAEDLKSFDPEIEVEALRMRTSHPDAKSRFARSDAIVCGFDNDESRLDMGLYAARHLIPLLDMGSGIYLDRDWKVEEKGAQIRFYIPGGPCLLCQGLDASSIKSETLRSNMRSAGYVEGTGESPASVITLNAVVSSMALDLLASYLTGSNLPVPTTLIYDELGRRLIEVESKKDKDCPICGTSGVEGLGDEVAPALAPRVREEWGGVPPADVHTKGDFRCQS